MTRFPVSPSASFILTFALAFLVPTVSASILQSAYPLKRDGIHAMHGHHQGAPLLELNETEVLIYHAPTPESYFTIDWDGADGPGPRYPALIITHVILMCLAFFVAFPLGIALRSVKHPGRSLAVAAFYCLCALGCASSALYRKLTPNMYQGAVHARHGYLIFLLAISLSAVDILSLFRRIFIFFRGDDKFSLKTFWTSAVLGRDHRHQASTRDVLTSEYTGLVNPQSDPEFEEPKFHPSDQESSDLAPQEYHRTARWANDVQNTQHDEFERRHYRHQSIVSDGTLCGNSPHMRSLEKVQELGDAKFSLLRRLRNVSYAVLERSIVFAGLLQLLTGIVTYTGGCRGNYINGCLAHLIKGAIFWCYGLFSFARFLGTFSELGWAWNRSPRRDVVSGEFVECFVIFLYGITNTWMERFGARPGDPFTTKQIQHISIAVMFWFAGLIGMGIESKRIRRWLSSATFVSVPANRLEPDLAAEPPSYIGSFNPFPALVIGVTGAAMAAHAQTYLFQVQIHQLWGNLLVAFAVLRCFTYFFLWIAPPRSILPSRPPTEAVGSFFLACGGLVFMFSTEEVSLAALRRGRDDIMMFLNVAVAITCFAFCWALFVVGFKAWLKSRSRPAVTSYRSA